MVTQKRTSEWTPQMPLVMYAPKRRQLRVFGMHWDEESSLARNLRKERARAYVRPSGKSTDAIPLGTDPRDSKDALGTQLVGAIGRSIVSGLRLDLPKSNPELEPLKRATNGRFSGPSNGGMYGRAFTSSSFKGEDVSRLLICEGILAFASLGLKWLSATYVSTFPKLGDIQDMGFQIYRDGPLDNGAYQVDLADGVKDWQLVPGVLRIDSKTIKQATNLQHDIAARIEDAWNVDVEINREQIISAIRSTHERRPVRAAA